MFLPGKFKAIERKIRSVGVFRTMILIAAHLKNMVFHRKYLIYFAEISADQSNQYPPKYPLNAKEISTLDQLSNGDVLAIVQYGGEGYIKSIQKRLNNNWILYLGYVGEDLGGAAWLVPDFSEFKTRSIQYVDNSVSIIDCWTIPEHRGKGVYPFLLTYIVQRLRTKDLSKVFIEVNEINYPSIKGIEKAGFHQYIL